MIEDWRPLAACRGCDPDLWFTERGESQREAAAVCKRCPVRQECLEYAIAAGERFGIWGGVSERQRRRIRVARGSRAGGQSRRREVA